MKKDIDSTNICTIFAGSYSNKHHSYLMKTRRVTLTEKEYELIESIRNYRKSYIFSGPEIVYYIEKLFTELMDGEE